MAKKIRKKFKKYLLWLFIFFLVAIAVPVGLYDWVIQSTASQILTTQQASYLEDVDCILVLGCAVRPDGTPSPMLAERLDKGIELYTLGVAPKLLLSGDNGQVEYNEVAAMANYALNKDVPSYDIFLDYAGFSTYESVYRAKEIFQAQKIVIVTQKYHLHRALYIAQAMGLEAYGVNSDTQVYAGQTNRDVREILARNKDFLTSIFKPKPTSLGDPVPVDGPSNLVVE